MKLSGIFYLAGFASIILSAINYLTGKSSAGDSEQQRNGIFVGHWAPTFFILGKIAEDRERAGDGQPFHL